MCFFSTAGLPVPGSYQHPRLLSGFPVAPVNPVSVPDQSDQDVSDEEIDVGSAEEEFNAGSAESVRK